MRQATEVSKTTQAITIVATLHNNYMVRPYLTAGLEKSTSTQPRKLPARRKSEGAMQAAGKEKTSGTFPSTDPARHNANLPRQDVPTGTMAAAL